MAQSSHGPLETQKITDLDLNATAELLATDLTLTYGMVLDNTQNVVSSFLKIYDSSVGTAVGTTLPDFVFRVNPGEVLVIVPVAGVGLPLNYQTGGQSYVAGVTTGGTAGSTAPTNDFKGTFLTD